MALPVLFGAVLGTLRVWPDPRSVKVPPQELPLAIQLAGPDGQVTAVKTHELGVAVRTQPEPVHWYSEFPVAPVVPPSAPTLASTAAAIIPRSEAAREPTHVFPDATHEPASAAHAGGAPETCAHDALVMPVTPLLHCTVAFP